MQQPWIGTQYWDAPMFMHWPVPYESLRPLVPAPFELDRFNSDAWIGIVLFKATRTKPRWGSGLLSLGPYWQLNVRTYIHVDDKPAVYFLNVYTNSRLSNVGAKSVLSLPFQHASFQSFQQESRFVCRMQQTARMPAAHMSADIRPSSEQFRPDRGTLAHWLTERYYFYAIKGRRIIEAGISHAPWHLQEARHDITHQHFSDAMSGAPLVHIGSPQAAYLYPFAVKGKYIR